MRACLQVSARRELGEDVTIFERIDSGVLCISKGDVVRLAVKPAIIGRVRERAVGGCCRGGGVQLDEGRARCGLGHGSVPLPVADRACCMTHCLLSLLLLLFRWSTSV